MNVHVARSVKCHLVKQEYWRGMAVLHENSSVADVYYEYSSGGLDRMTALKLLVT